MTRRNSSPPLLSSPAPWTLINQFTAPEDLPVLQLLADCYVCDSFRAITPLPQCGLFGPTACQKLNVTADQRAAPPQAQEVAHSLFTRLFRSKQRLTPCPPTQPSQPPTPTPETQLGAKSETKFRTKSKTKFRDKSKTKVEKHRDDKSGQSSQALTKHVSLSEAASGTNSTLPLEDESDRKKSVSVQSQMALENLVCLLDIAVHPDIAHVFLHVLVSLTSQLDDIQLPEVNISTNFLRAAGQETTISDMAGSLANYAESVSATLASTLKISKQRRSSHAPRRSSNAPRRSSNVYRRASDASRRAGDAQRRASNAQRRASNAPQPVTNADQVCTPDSLYTPSGSGVTSVPRSPQFVTEAFHQAALSDADSSEEAAVVRGCGGFWRRGRRPAKTKWPRDTAAAKVDLQPVLPLRRPAENVVLTSFVDDDNPPGAADLWADTARDEVLNSPTHRLTHRPADTQSAPSRQPLRSDLVKESGSTDRPKDSAGGRDNASVQEVESPRTASRLRKVLHFRSPARKREASEAPEDREERLYLLVVEVISCLASVVAFAEQTGALAVVLRLREAVGGSRKLARIAELERALSVWLLNCHKVATPCLFTDRPWGAQTHAIVTSCPMSRGDHLYRQIRGKGTLSLMTHHGMYVGEGRVIHFSGNEFALKSLLFPSQESTKLRKTNILEFMKYGGVLHVEKYLDTINDQTGVNGAPGAGAGAALAGTTTPMATPSTVASRSEVIRVEGRSEPVSPSPLPVEKVEYNKHMILWPTQAMCFSEKGAYYAQADSREQAARRAEFAYAFFHWRRALKGNVAAAAEPALQALLQEMASDFEFPAYSLFSNNCEHFCRWCKTGTAISLQVDVVGATVDAFLRGFFHK